MNYNDQILENKAFNFFKQLVYNIALAICIMLIGVLIMVYGFGFKLYEVLSDSQAPYFTKGDMVIVKAQKEYKVGDIIKFDETNGVYPTTHRLIGIYENAKGEITYICHGDNVQSAKPDDDTSAIIPWKEDAAYIQNLIDNEGYTLSEIKNKATNIQTPTPSQVEGKVVADINNYGTYFNFIKSHYLLLITLIAGIWCICSTVQNEIDIKRCKRLV